MQIGMTINVSNEFLQDVLDTAVEGGINHWGAPTLVRKGNFVDTYTVTDAEGDNAFPDFTLSQATIVDGLKHVLGKPTPPCRADIHASIVQAVLAGDAGRLDVECADVIVQFGHFGEIVFG